MENTNFCKRAEIKVLEKVRGSVFQDLDEHRKDCDLSSEDDHVCQLIKGVTSLFVKIMLHNQSRVFNEQFVMKNSASQRHKLTKTILFLHQ